MTETETHLDALVRLGKALSDRTRCRLLLALLPGPAYPAELAETLGTTRQNVSNHLLCLRECGIVTVTHEGRRARYALRDERIQHAITDIAGLTLTVSHGHEPS
ncbi:ArsR/SmtB family transcription factor [Actinocrispum wychmicini]|uniref:DNA-binding transcriptional ArsR family regulator n=1 Tax=Actinocrispum wychmicini TaxID=1213861 RepID=A0A4R2JTK5_9PSEU|nr:metalloregulator ArsR/SmtB family transcription factor [Actinocrispum wychmicini]TCO60606.1 DNA-binding transcriptional ArsR family regulator [Actinocrispum wychmicini]